MRKDRTEVREGVSHVREENSLMGPPENRDARAGECVLYLRNSEEGRRFGAKTMRTEELERRSDRKCVPARWEEL